MEFDTATASESPTSYSLLQHRQKVDVDVGTGKTFGHLDAQNAAVGTVCRHLRLRWDGGSLQKGNGDVLHVRRGAVYGSDRCLEIGQVVTDNAGFCLEVPSVTSRRHVETFNEDGLVVVLPDR